MKPALTLSPLDSREHSRSRYSVPIQILFCECDGDSQTDFISSAVCHDISRSGMRIYSSETLDNKIFSIRIPLPNGSEVREFAHAVRCLQKMNDLFEYGLQFETLLSEAVIIEIENESLRLSQDPESMLT